MKRDWIRKAAALPPRQLHLMGAGLLLIVGAALWMYALRAPLASLRVLRAEQAQLALAGSDPRPLAAQLAVLGGESDALAKRLGSAATRPSAQLLVGLMGELGALARDQGVRLHGVTPAPEQTTLAFAQIGFDIEASASYASLLAWMGAIERSRPNLSVVSFDMQPAETPGQVDMTIRIAAYRPQENKP